MVNILIRYLGIKTKLLEPIKTAIDEVTPANGCVLDLFAGSNTVGQYLLDTYKVFTNDYQKYSYIAANALIEYHPPELINNIDSELVFGDYYQSNYQILQDIFKKPLQEESKMLAAINETYYGKTFDKFVDFFNNSPFYINTLNKHNSFDDCLDYFSIDTITNYKSNPKRFPYLLFTTYYNNPYFSLRQCLEIDSIRYSIDQLLDNNLISPEEHSIYLSFLIYSLNLVVISVGDHFAQPQKIKEVSIDLRGKRDKINLRERKKIITKKRLSVKDLYCEKLNDYKANYVCGNVENKAFNMDYKELLQSEILANSDINTVYIDPPYTNAHYSRFYHIPETLVLYDYPEIEYSGRYRSDRYQSSFCIKSKAKEEFSCMLKLCKKNNYNAIISYSDTEQCILKIEDIKEICKEHYNTNIRFDNIAHMYRNFGQKPNKVLAKEYIITCYIEETKNEKIHG